MTAAAAPSPSIQEMIAGHWRDLLGSERALPGDDFLALGGNSMLATLLANRIEDELGVRPQIVDLFATLEQIARVCEALVAEQAGGAP
jgi:hypothetical protein